VSETSSAFIFTAWSASQNTGYVSPKGPRNSFFIIVEFCKKLYLYQSQLYKPITCSTVHSHCYGCFSLRLTHINAVLYRFLFYTFQKYYKVLSSRCRDLPVKLMVTTAVQKTPAFYGN
jgi:hypothetical protein